MEIVKRLPVILALVFVLGTLLSISGAIEETGETVREWSPEKMVQATATAQAIPLMNEPTRTWIEVGVPTLQAVEASEISATTRNREKWRRTTDSTKAIAGIARTVSFVIFVALASIGAGIGLGGWWGAKGVREIRQARLPMTRQIGEGPHVTEWGTVFHTVTGGVARLDTPQDAMPEHARLVSPTYQALPAPLVAQLLSAVSNGTATGAERAQVRYLVDGDDRQC